MARSVAFVFVVAKLVFAVARPVVSVATFVFVAAVAVVCALTVLARAVAVVLVVAKFVVSVVMFVLFAAICVVFALMVIAKPSVMVRDAFNGRAKLTEVFKVVILVFVDVRSVSLAYNVKVVVRSVAKTLKVIAVLRASVSVSVA